MLCSCFSLSVHKIICSPWQKVQAELDGLKKELNSLTEKAEEILASPQQASSSPILRSELDITLKKMDHVYGLSSIYLDKWGFLTHLWISVGCCGLCKDYLFDFRLKSIDGVIRNTKEAKDTLINYETRLRDVKQVPADEKELEDHRKMLKVFLFLWKNGSFYILLTLSCSKVMTLLFCLTVDAYRGRSRPGGVWPAARWFQTGVSYQWQNDEDPRGARRSAGTLPSVGGQPPGALAGCVCTDRSEAARAQPPWTTHEYLPWELRLAHPLAQRGKGETGENSSCSC